MTWSIIARDPATGALGAAVATRFLAAAGLCLNVGSGAGALSTQALINPTYGPRGLALLRGGAPAPDVVQMLTDSDAGRATRQVHVVDWSGRAAAYTGSDCIEWCGHRSGENLSVAGNMLAGPQVVADTYEGFLRAAGKPFAERLLDALDAGQAAGGDKRGQQSAGILIYGTEDYPDLSLRVDDHATPLVELRRLYGLWLGRFAAFRACMATAANPAGIHDRAIIEAEVQRREKLLPETRSS